MADDIPPNLAPAEDRHAPLLAQVARIIADGTPQAEIARGAGISSSALSTMLARTYTGNTDNMAAKLERWLTARAERATMLAGLPVAPDWYDTPTAAAIERTLNYAQVANDLVVIIGGAGTGKTRTCRRYAADWPNAWHVEFESVDGRQLAALQVIAQHMGLRDLPSAPNAVSRAIKAKLRGTQGLLILDEAQHLDVAALEAIRGIHDAKDVGVGVALCGNESLYTRMTGGTRASDRAQLFSRIGKRLRLGPPSVGDVAALCDAWGVQDQEARKVLAAIAGKAGALRVATKVLRLASVRSGSGGITAASLRDEWKGLGVDA